MDVMSFETSAVEFKAAVTEKVEPREQSRESADKDGREETGARGGKVDSERGSREGCDRSRDEVHDFAVASGVEREIVRGVQGIRVAARVRPLRIATPHASANEEKEEGRHKGDDEK